MSLSRYINRLRRLDALIRRKSTGTPGELAAKLEISERWLYILLEELREEMDCPIRYDRNRKSYYYAKAGRIHIGFQAELDKAELKHVNGGMDSGKLCSIHSQKRQVSESAPLEATIVAGWIERKLDSWLQYKIGC